MHQERINRRVPAPRAGPRHRQDVVDERHRRLLGVVVPDQLLGVHDDISLEIDAAAEGRDLGGGIAEVDDAGAKIHAPGLRGVHDGVVEQRIEIALFGGDRVVAVEEQIPDHRDLRGAAPAAAARNRGRTVRRAVAVDMQEDVPLDPRVGAVEIQDVVRRADEDVVVELDDRLPGRLPPVKSMMSL